MLAGDARHGGVDLDDVDGGLGVVTHDVLRIGVAAPAEHERVRDGPARLVHDVEGAEVVEDEVVSKVVEIGGGLDRPVHHEHADLLAVLADEVEDERGTGRRAHLQADARTLELAPSPCHQSRCRRGDGTARGEKKTRSPT